MSEQVQIMEVYPSGPAKTPGKVTPHKVRLSNGKTCTLGKGVSIADVPYGAQGVAEVESTQNGEYWNHRITSWAQTAPPGEAPHDAPTAAAKTAPVDQSVWDAKDRAMAMENAHKASATVIAALIGAGVVKDVNEALTAWETLSTEAFGMTQLARQDRLSTKANPFGSDV